MHPSNNRHNRVSSVSCYAAFINKQGNHEENLYHFKNTMATILAIIQLLLKVKQEVNLC